MGIFNSSGSLARAFGPISVGFLYKRWGPRIMMIFMLLFVVSAIITVAVNFKRLYIDPDAEKNADSDDDDDDDLQGINSRS